MKQQCLVNTGEISSEIAEIHTKEEKNSERDRFLTFYKKERLKDQRQVSLIQELRDDPDKMADCSTKQEICSQF